MQVTRDWRKSSLFHGRRVYLIILRD